MRNFYLKYNNLEKDIIMKVVANSLDQAISFFSKVKKLEKDELLRVFIVTDQI